MIFTKNNPLRVFEICAGYGSQALALKRLTNTYPEFAFELVGWCEFDPESNQPIDKQSAVIAHNALHPEGIGKNYGDLTKMDWSIVPDIDLLTYSTPCQSVSQAGLQHGFAEGSGTRSSIIWNVRDAVRIKRPKFLMLENVKAMVTEKFVGMFNLWQLELERLGYRNFAQVLNAKDYGVPQNRERIFLVSIRVDDEHNMPKYYFPKPFPLERRLKDVLEENVDEKYYLSDEMLERFQQDGRVNSSQDGVISDRDGVSQCHSAGHGNCPKVIEDV